MIKLRWVALASVALLLLSTTAMAQPGGGRGGPGGFFGGMGGFGGPGGGSLLGLLRIEQIQKELDLLPDQIEKIQKLQEESRNEMRDLFSGFGEMSREERQKAMEGIREKMAKRRAEMDKKVKGILVDHQTERLMQINIQLQGDRALANEQVLEMLEITPKQKKDLEAIRDKLQEKMRKMGEEIQKSCRSV